ncbi:MAG: hypothetical protein QG623_406 [Patescibacteria group bacterium]|nr:hypothetical protein [Patescibacteria group bacterium]
MDPVQGGQQQPVQPQQPVPQPVQPQIQQQPVQQPMPASPPQPQPAAQPQMPQLNDQFLQEVGLGVLPEVERSGMLEQMKKTLETNVGMEIYKNLQDHQLQEFEGFMPLNDENGQVINSEDAANANAQRWLDVNVPTYKTNQALQPYLNDPARIRDFAAMNWLQRNFPAYRDVVAAELNKLMTEVRNNVSQIIEAVMGPQNLNQPQPQQMPQQNLQDPNQNIGMQPPVAPAA